MSCSKTGVQTEECAAKAIGSPQTTGGDRTLQSQRDRAFLWLSVVAGQRNAAQRQLLNLKNEHVPITDPEILRLSLGGDGGIVAHTAATLGQQFTDMEILKLANYNGVTVAHEAAKIGQQFTDTGILQLADDKGWTVAHYAAYKGQQFTDPAILKLANRAGTSVAHYAAEAGQQFTDPEILNLANARGLTVADVARRKKTPGPSA